MKPFVARLAGAGSIVVLALGTTAFTVQQRAEAASPVCFTVTGGDCYCVDFFLTTVKEKVTSKAQQYVNNLMGEFNDLKGMGIQEALNAHIGNGYTYDGLLDEATRTAMDKPASQRALPDSPSIPPGIRKTMEGDPGGKSLAGRRARAVASASGTPENLTPYSVSQSPDEEGVSPERAIDWVDRTVIEPTAVNVPDDVGLAEMPAARLLDMYERTRQVLGANYARYYLKELASSEARLKALSKSRETLVLDHVDQPGAVQSAGLVAKTLNLAIDAELLESQLRQETLVASLMAMRIGSAYETQ